TEPIEVDGHRRVCFREPGADAIVEIMEEDPALPAGLAGSAAPRSAVAYVTVSVSDLDAARRYLGTLFGFPEIEPETLHRPEHESLWGLTGARRTCAVFQAGDLLLEAVQYETPTPEPPPADALLSDQGIMNVAMGYRERSALVDTVAAAEAAGASVTGDVPDTTGSVYLRIADGISIELFLVPVGLDA